MGLFSLLAVVNAACFQTLGISPSSQILLYTSSKYFIVADVSLFIIWEWIVFSPGTVFFCCFMADFSFLSVNGLLYGSFSFSLFALIYKIVWYLVRWGDYISSSFQWRYCSWFIVSVYFPKFIPYLLGLSSGVQWVHELVSFTLSSFSENSLFDRSPTLEWS